MSTKINSTILTTDLGGLIKGIQAEFYAVHDDIQNQAKPMYTSIFNTDTGTGAQGHEKIVSGVDGLKPVAEGQKIPELSEYLGDEVTYKYFKFGGDIVVSKESIDDTDWKSELSSFKKLSKGSQADKDKHAFMVINKGFDSGTSFDGFNIFKMTNHPRLFSVAHSLANGTTYSNVLSNSAPLSNTSLQAMINLLIKTPLENGEPQDFSGPKVLLVPTALHSLALQITQSIRVQGSNNNDMNVFSNIEVMSSPRLDAQFGGSDTAFYLLAKGDMNGLYFIERAPITMESKYDELTQVIHNIISGRWAAGFKDWKGIVASKGDNSTISV